MRKYSYCPGIMSHAILSICWHHADYAYSEFGIRQFRTGGSRIYAPGRETYRTREEAAFCICKTLFQERRNETKRANYTAFFKSVSPLFQERLYLSPPNFALGPLFHLQYWGAIPYRCRCFCLCFFSAPPDPRMADRESTELSWQ